jgi:hypothetical protein
LQFLDHFNFPNLFFQLIDDFGLLTDRVIFLADFGQDGRVGSSTANYHKGCTSDQNDHLFT